MVSIPTSFHLPSVEELEAFGKEADDAITSAINVISFVQRHENYIPGLSKYAPEVEAFKLAVEVVKRALDQVPPA